MSENMQDWEAEFEDFDWQSPDEQASTAGQHDESLVELLSSLDDVHATDALKQSTVKRAVLQDAKADRHIRLPEAPPERRRRPFAARTTHRARWIIPVACVAIVLLGVVLWFVPVSSIQVTQDDLSVDLGVNVYGYAVSAQAKGTVGEQVIASSAIGNRGYGEAIEQLLAGYEKMREGEPGGAISVDVNSPGGIGSEALHRGAERVIERFGGSGRQESEQPSAVDEERSDAGIRGQEAQDGASPQDEVPQGGVPPMASDQPEPQADEPRDAVPQEPDGNGADGATQRPTNNQDAGQSTPFEGGGAMPGAEGFDQGGMPGLGGQEEAPMMTFGQGDLGGGPGV